MKFNSFKEVASKIKNLPLPGEVSQFKMAPETRVSELRNHFRPSKTPKLAGVMALFYPDNTQEATLLLILRKSYPGIHSNQIGFPGGKLETQDENLMATALRETYEEVGVHPSRVTIVRELTPLYIPPSNFKVSPFLGISGEPLSFTLQDDEVEEVIEVPLRMLLDKNYQGTSILRTSYSPKMEVPVYNFRGHTVWGATAMMLSELRDLIIKVC